MNKTKKSIGQVTKWTRLNRYISNNLNQQNKLKREWIIIVSLSGLFVLFFGILLGIMVHFLGLSGINYPVLGLVRSLNNSMYIMSIIAICLLGVPYIYMGAAFFSGINQIYKSKFVHFFIWFTFVVNAILVLVCSCILIAAYAGLDGYNLIRNFL